MSPSAQTRSSGEHRSYGGGGTSLEGYPQPYNVTTYIPNYLTHFHALGFSMLPTFSFTVPFSPGSCDTAVDSWRKLWKPWGGCGSFTLKVACHKMDFTFFQCLDEDDYQKMLASLLAKVRRSSTVLTVLPTVSLCTAENMDHLYSVANRLFWTEELQFEALVGDPRGLFAGWPNVELFSKRVYDRSKFYCQVSAC